MLHLLQFRPHANYTVVYFPRSDEHFVGRNLRDLRRGSTREIWEGRELESLRLPLEATILLTYRPWPSHVKLIMMI